jgi:hypothetical protein
VRDSGIPDDLVALWQGTDGVDQRTARAVIDLAMRVGETLLSTGASASDVVATVLRLIDAYGLRSVHVDVTFTSISVSYHRGPDADPMTVMRGVKVRSADLTRLERLQTLVRDIAQEPVEIDVARARFDDLIKSPHPYRRWVVRSRPGWRWRCSLPRRLECPGCRGFRRHRSLPQAWWCCSRGCPWSVPLKMRSTATTSPRVHGSSRSWC